MRTLNDNTLDINQQFDNNHFQIDKLNYISNISTDIPTVSKNISVFQKVDDSEKKELMQKVANYKLSDYVKYFINEYNKVFAHRNEYLWKWLGIIYGETGVTLSTVDNNYNKSITDSKIILTMAFSVLDDLSEYYKDEGLLNKIFEIIQNPDGEIDNSEKMLVFYKDIWNYFIKTISEYPRYEEFKDIFWYDFNQVINSVKYNIIAGKHPEMINLREMQNYDCHNMIVFLLNGIDLMVSPDFNKEDLPLMRTAFWHAQQMARIGNWLSTWKREIKEKDLCSGVVGFALSNGVISIEDFKNQKDEEIITKIENSTVKDYFYKYWMNNFEEIKQLKYKIKSVDIDAYTTGLNNLIKLHMASEGYK